VIRAFTAIALPEPVRADLSILQLGLPVPRTVPPDNLHLTLLFLGELPEPVLEDVDLALRRLRAPPIDVALGGVGLFGGSKPRVVYVGAAERPALRHLHAKIAAAARGARLEPEVRRYVPHVTLARLPERGVDRPRLEAFVAARTGYAAPPFQAEDFRLYRSHLTGSGAAYEELARYPLDLPVGRPNLDAR
jgi:2'-5' RNA ligase